MIYILKILSKNNSKIRLSFYLPWVGIFIGTVFLLLINSIMDGMENEIFTNLNEIDGGYKVTSSSIEELNQIQRYLDINKFNGNSYTYWYCLSIGDFIRHEIWGNVTIMLN